jgi:beta-lactamase regulating signal transducer with metallopeptidase domain
VRSWPGSIRNVVTIPESGRFTDLPSAEAIVNSMSAPTWERNDASGVTTITRRDLPPWWLMAWVAGTVMMLAWGLFGRIGLAVLGHRATPINSGRWREIVDATTVRLGVTRRISILQSAEVGAPMTWGIRRPVLVVPPQSATWSDALLQSVAAHEVAHVARRDYLTQLMSMAACAVYWFHPLVWGMARRMRQTAERACDDQVLALGATGEEYAAHLIGVARTSRQLRLGGAVAIGMARPSTLEGRVVAVLDAARARSAPTSAIRRAIATAAALTLVLVGTVRPVAASGPTRAPMVFTTSEPSKPASSELVPSSSVSSELVPSSSASETITTVQPAASVPETQDPDSIIERTFNASPGGLLTLALDAGGGVTVRGWDDDRVRVRAGLGGRDWRDIDIEIERESGGRGGVRVEDRFVRRRGNQSFSNHYEILVPRRYDVRVASAGGELTIIGVEGRFTGHTGGGEITLERVTGMARLATGGGEVLVRDSDLSGSVQTGGGMVRLSNVKGGLRGSSGSGPVIYGTSDDRTSRSTTDISSIKVDDGSRIIIGRDTEYRSGTLNIEKAGGDVNLSAAPNGAHVRTGGGDVRVGPAAGQVDASTGGGDVTVGPAAGSVRAGTGAGEVRIIVDRGREPQVIEATSGSGRVIIELPADFDGRLELETAYTRTHESRARINSDWDLERDPLTGWDDRYGTPRRYVRARTVLGRGTGRVVVRTVNGEIEIRRR